MFFFQHFVSNVVNWHVICWQGIIFENDTYEESLPGLCSLKGTLHGYCRLFVDYSLKGVGVFICIPRYWDLSPWAVPCVRVSITSLQAFHGCVSYYLGKSSKGQYQVWVVRRPSAVWEWWRVPHDDRPSWRSELEGMTGNKEKDLEFVECRDLLREKGEWRIKQLSSFTCNDIRTLLHALQVDVAFAISFSHELRFQWKLSWNYLPEWKCEDDDEVGARMCDGMLVHSFDDAFVDAIFHFIF